MDQIKIGRFIAELRKEKGLTQKELAERLSISDKTVSKWERGSGLPEVSLMMPLCLELGITVNELLSAKRLSSSEYQNNAEENIVKLIKEKEETKFRLIIETIVVFLTIVAACTIIMITGYVELKTWVRVLLIVVALVIMFGGIGVAAALEMRSAVFKCSKCGHVFEPTKAAYIMGAHTITRRRLKCPNCQKRNWCKRLLSLEETEDKGE